MCFSFSVKDIKEFGSTKEMEIVLEKVEDKIHLCSCCGEKLGAQEGRYRVKARHLRCFGWNVTVSF